MFALSLLGDNTVFTAEPDGLTIGLLNYPGHVFAQLTDTEQVEYDSPIGSGWAGWRPVLR